LQIRIARQGFLPSKRKAVGSQPPFSTSLRERGYQNSMYCGHIQPGRQRPGGRWFSETRSARKTLAMISLLGWERESTVGSADSID
jgi:hypothetical protein